MAGKFFSINQILCYRELRACGLAYAETKSWSSVNGFVIDLYQKMAVPKDGFTAKWCLIQVEVAREQSTFEADKNLAAGVMLIPRIVILVKQSPRSNSNYKATISGLKEVTKPGEKQRSFEVQITNNGDNVIDALVNLALADMQTAKEQKFSPLKVTVYPDASRTVKLELPEVLPKGKYALAAILDYGHRQPLGGTQMMLEIK